MEIDRDTLLRSFTAESDDALGEMEDALLELEKRPDPERLHAVFRLTHSLKGNAAILGFDELAELAHVAEELLDRLRGGAVPWTRSVVTLALRAVDALRDLLQRSVAQETAGERPARAPSLRPPGRAEARTARVDVAKLDRMLDLTGELAMARERLRRIIAAKASAAELDAHDTVDALCLSLQEEITGARLFPLGPALRRLSRVVRDVAAAHGKEAKVVITGGDVELDLGVAEQIRDPLTHMVRNAVSHGIEAPSAREAAGKPRAGTISIRAFAEASSVVVEVEDDGAGMSRARILAAAIERGLIGPGEQLSDEQILELAFRPGFSTAPRVTDLSGRGVGLDIVRRNVEELRGVVRVSSAEGRGTTVTLRVPLTLALIEGFSVEAGGETFVIPMDAVVECLELPRAKSAANEPTGLFSARGEPVPFVRIRRLFGLAAGAPGREHVVIVRHAGGALGVAVDALIGSRQMVIKPLGPMLRKSPGIAGAAVLGDGGVALILDVPSLARAAFSRPEVGPLQGALS